VGENSTRDTFADWTKVYVVSGVYNIHVMFVVCHAALLFKKWQNTSWSGLGWRL